MKTLKWSPSPVNEDDYDSKIVALGGSGELPAIIEYSQDQAKTSVSNQFTNLDAVKEVIDQKGEDSFYEGALDVTKTEDGSGYVGVPICSWVQGIWVNTAMLQEKGLGLPETGMISWKWLQHSMTRPTKNTALLFPHQSQPLQSRYFHSTLCPMTQTYLTRIKMLR